ncbi:MAG TPA: hypothetical protein VG603_02020 [Chitinophagales bacterium]|nr:hypothetical protein [Chitinophagales bacterium]
MKPVTAVKILVFLSLWVTGSIISWNYSKKDLKRLSYYDVEGYYMYLPATIINGSFENLPVQTQVQFTNYPGTGKIFTKYTYGVAALLLPFFLIAHGITLLVNPAGADGYSFYYMMAIIVAAVFYMLLGLYLLYKTLAKRFSTPVSLLVPLLILTGTNLYFYTICQPGMSHVYSFFLFAVVVFLTPKILAGAPLKYWLMYGFTFGLIVVIRPTNCVLLLYPLLYGIYSLPLLAGRALYLITAWRYILWAIVAFFIMFIPQLIYWKYISGSYIIYSYSNEGFLYWSSPKILQVLFDVQNGWLLYSPLMVFAVIGLFFAIRQKVSAAVPLLAILPLITYIFASWWAWWFGGAFGHRCYIEYYALLAFSLAAFIKAVGRNKYASVAVFLLFGICIYYNLMLTYLYFPPWDGPDWNWQRFSTVLQKLL